MIQSTGRSDYFFKWAIPGVCFVFSFFFKQTLQFYNNKIMSINFHSNIRCWDSNPRSLESESPPITTRPVQGGVIVSFPIFVHYLESKNNVLRAEKKLILNVTRLYQLQWRKIICGFTRQDQLPYCRPNRK